MLIAQITDMHLKPPGELLYKRIDTAGFLERAVAHVNALDPRPDVVLATGDLVEGGTPGEYALLRRLLAPLAMPVYLIPGNHDARDALREGFADHAYLPPSGFLQYTIENLPVRLIALDTLVPGKGYGALCAERLDWLEARLAESDRADDRVHASSAVRLRHRRLRQLQTERGRRATGRACAPSRQCRARDVRPCPSSDPGALGRHHGLDRPQHGPSGDARSAGRRAAVDDDGTSRSRSPPVAPGHRSDHACELHRNLRRPAPVSLHTMTVAQSRLGERLSLEGLFKKLGPGVITGAADDDPSGIATYSQAGAQGGFNLLWTVVLTWPLMVGGAIGQRAHRPRHRPRPCRQHGAGVPAPRGHRPGRCCCSSPTPSISAPISPPWARRRG